MRKKKSNNFEHSSRFGASNVIINKCLSHPHRGSSSPGISIRLNSNRCEFSADSFCFPMETSSSHAPVSMHRKRFFSAPILSGLNYDALRTLHDLISLFLLIFEYFLRSSVLVLTNARTERLWEFPGSCAAEADREEKFRWCEAICGIPN